jgi:tetratricopeptide (TPR) repeat protein
MFVRYLAVGATLLIGAAAAPAQSPVNHIALGDSAHARMKPAEALAHYKEAIATAPYNYEALWKASRDAVDLGEFEPDKAKQKAFFSDGERYARSAVAVKPDGVDGHFQVARSLGRVALSLGKKDRVRYAKEVRVHALEALKLDSLHAGALHVMGVWNAEVMRLSGFSRFMAKNFLGGDVFREASWKNAKRYMEKSVEVDPHRLVHHLDLGKIYADTHDKEKAREQFQLVIDGPATDYNDRFYKQDAERQLAKLK